MNTHGERRTHLKRTMPIARFAAMLLPFFVLCGCSSFNRDWKKAAHEPPPQDSFSGRWEGQWLSDANGHTGNLRCLLSRNDDGNYAARFRATYKKIFHFSYAVPLVVRERDGAWQFTGQEDLGSLAGGVYHYEGNATPTNFHSTYRSKYDHGVFEMLRPE